MGVHLPRFLWALALLVALVAIGTAGYALIEGWSLADSLYMTVITVTAVGYNEIAPMGQLGRDFTMLLLFGGITWMGFWFATLTSFIVELDLRDVFKRRRTSKEIEKMKGHIIICGAGRTGRQVAQELRGLSAEFVIVENDPARVEALSEFLPGAHVVEGDATHDSVLLEAGLPDAYGLITCLSADSDNLFVCLSARDLAGGLKIVARAYEEETMDKLYRAGADHVVSPNVSGAIRMASVLLRPSVVSFLDVVTRSPGLALRLEQATVSDGSAVAGKRLDESGIQRETGLIVIALGKGGAPASDFVFNPSGDTRVEAGDELIVLGEEPQVRKLRTYVS